MLLRRTRPLFCEAVRKVVFKRSPHEILGVDRMSTEEEVKAAYQALIKEKHPDKGGCADEFQSIQEAYKTVLRGAPGHMVFGRPEPKNPLEETRDVLKDRVKDSLEKRGYTVDYDQMGTDYIQKTSKSVWLVRMLIAVTLYFYLSCCTPPQYGKMAILTLTYAIDYIFGWFLLVWVFPPVLIYTVHEGHLHGFFTRAGSYWAVDRATALTAAFGIPNVYQPGRIELPKFARARESRLKQPTSSSSYKNIIGQV